MSKAVTGILGGEPATFQDYRRLFTTAARPEKFSAEEAGFRANARQAGIPPCETCVHWYANPKTGRTVCEVVRLAGEANIRGSSTCRFQTGDGIHYPLLHEI